MSSSLEGKNPGPHFGNPQAKKANLTVQIHFFKLAIDKKTQPDTFTIPSLNLTKMKNLTFVLAGLLTLSSIPAGAAEVQTSFPVKSDVVASCRFQNIRNMDFGAYDPVGVNATANLSGRNGGSRVICTKGTVVTIKLDQGQHAQSGSSCESPLRSMVNTNGDRLNYFVRLPGTETEPNLFGCGAANSFSISSVDLAPRSMSSYGYIPSGQNAKSGAYSDTVTYTAIF